MPVLHVDLCQIRRCWVTILFKERQDSFALLWFLKECQFPVPRGSFEQDSWDNLAHVGVI